MIKHYNLVCRSCNGHYIGDGYNDVVRCEFAHESLYEYHEPDANPVDCLLNGSVVFYKCDENGSNKFKLESRATKQHIIDDLYDLDFDFSINQEEYNFRSIAYSTILKYFIG